MSNPGADRWTTKFLLKEHIEGYETRNEKPMGDQPTIEELTMMRDYILLPFLLTVVQRNIDKMKEDKVLLKTLYVGLAEHIASSIDRDLYQLRRELTRRNIRITPGDMEDDFLLNYVYRYRGYSGDFGITREELKTQMSLRLGKYVDGIFGVLAEAQKK
jgi:hypothetical protein